MFTIDTFNLGSPLGEKSGLKPPTATHNPAQRPPSRHHADHPITDRPVRRNSTSCKTALNVLSLKPQLGNISQNYCAIFHRSYLAGRVLLPWRPDRALVVRNAASRSDDKPRHYVIRMRDPLQMCFT